MVRRPDKIGSLIFVGIRNGQKKTAKAGAPHLIFRRKIRATEKWLPIGQQKSRQGPAALAGDRADGGLITRVYIRAFVAVDFYGHKILVNNSCDLGIFVALAVDDM